MKNSSSGESVDVGYDLLLAPTPLSSTVPGSHYDQAPCKRIQGQCLGLEKTRLMNLSISITLNIVLVTLQLYFPGGRFFYLFNMCLTRQVNLNEMIIFQG